MLSIVHSSLKAERPQIEIVTSLGSITVELAPYRAPATVDNFLKYVKRKYYDQTVIHRVEQDFVIQGGGFDTKYNLKETNRGIRNESNNGLNNIRGSIAMARTDDLHSANSQFYINVSDNKSLDARYGRLAYTVFGKVLSGMDVVDTISRVKVGSISHVGDTVPVNQIVIKSIRLIEIKAEIKAEQKTEPKPKEKKKEVKS